MIEILKLNNSVYEVLDENIKLKQLLDEFDNNQSHPASNK
jgi:hypothetical protein